MIELSDIVLLVVSLIVSLGVGAWLLWSRTLRGRPLLTYQPRRPVPWNAIAGCLLASFLLFASVAGHLSSGSSIDSRLEGGAGMTAEEYLQASYLGGGISLVLVAVIAVSIAAGEGATLSDFGLPGDSGTLLRDFGIGAAAMGVGFGPVILTQLVVAQFFGSASRNATLLMLQESGSVALFAAAFFAAVIVAPIFEEFVCRLMLQGWLEKAEEGLYRFSENQPNRSGPPLREKAMAIGLTPGLAPVLISSLLFSLLHLGAGPDFVALFPFALIQGYLYQRTHRILPCVFHHMLFNTVGVVLTFWQGAGA